MTDKTILKMLGMTIAFIISYLYLIFILLLLPIIACLCVW